MAPCRLSLGTETSPGLQQSAAAAPKRTCTSTYGSKPSSYGMRYEMLVSNQRAWSVALHTGKPAVEARRLVGMALCSSTQGWLRSIPQSTLVGCAFRRGRCQGRRQGRRCLPMQQLHNVVQTPPAQPSAPVPAVVVVHVEAAQLAMLEQL